MGLIKHITTIINKKTNPLGIHFQMRKLCLKSLFSIEICNIKLSKVKNENQLISIDKSIIKISFWNLFRCRLNILFTFKNIVIDLEEFYPAPVKFNDTTLLSNYQKGLLLSEITLGKASCFIQVENYKKGIEVYIKVDNQSWNNILDSFRDLFSSDILRRSYSESKLSFFAYLKYFKNKNVPFFNANIEAPDFILATDKEYFATNITYEELKSLLISKILEGNSEVYSPLSFFPELLIYAFISTEDPCFIKHKGVDPSFVGLAIMENIEKKKISRGASTITMQVVRNLFLTRNRNIIRKIEECILSLLLENWCKISKNELIELYLNLIEFAPGIFGVKQATRHYFDKDPNELTVSEVIVMAYIIPRPIHFYDALLQQSDQLKKNLKHYIVHYSRNLLLNNFINEEMYNVISYKIVFKSLDITLDLNNY